MTGSESADDVAALLDVAVYLKHSVPVIVVVADMLRTACVEVGSLERSIRRLAHEHEAVLRIRHVVLPV